VYTGIVTADTYNPVNMPLLWYKSANLRTKHINVCKNEIKTMLLLYYSSVRRDSQYIYLFFLNMLIFHKGFEAAC